MVGFGQRLNLMILKVFSGLSDSMIPDILGELQGM